MDSAAIGESFMQSSGFIRPKAFDSLLMSNGMILTIELIALSVFPADCISLPSPISSRMGFTMPSLRNFAIDLKYISNSALFSMIFSIGESFVRSLDIINGIRPSETPLMTFGM